MHLQTLYEAPSPVILYRNTDDIFEQIHFVIQGMYLTLKNNNSFLVCTRDSKHQVFLYCSRYTHNNKKQGQMWILSFEVFIFFLIRCK